MLDMRTAGRQLLPDCSIWHEPLDESKGKKLRKTQKDLHDIFHTIRILFETGLNA